MWSRECIANVPAGRTRDCFARTGIKQGHGGRGGEGVQGGAVGPTMLYINTDLGQIFFTVCSCQECPTLLFSLDPNLLLVVISTTVALVYQQLSVW